MVEVEKSAKLEGIIVFSQCRRSSNKVAHSLIRATTSPWSTVGCHPVLSSAFFSNSPLPRWKRSFLWGCCLASLAFFCNSEDGFGTANFSFKLMKYFKKKTKKSMKLHRKISTNVSIVNMILIVSVCKIGKIIVHNYLEYTF